MLRNAYPGRHDVLVSTGRVPMQVTATNAEIQVCCGGDSDPPGDTAVCSIMSQNDELWVKLQTKPSFPSVYPVVALLENSAYINVCRKIWSLNVKCNFDFIHRWLLTSFPLKWISSEVFESQERQGTILCGVELSCTLSNILISPWLQFLNLASGSSVLARTKTSCTDFQTPH